VLVLVHGGAVVVVMRGGGVLQGDRVVDTGFADCERENARDETGQEAQEQAPDQQGAYHAAA
jgi:hypothetical protein